MFCFAVIEPRALDRYSESNPADRNTSFCVVSDLYVLWSVTHVGPDVFLAPFLAEEPVMLRFNKVLVLLVAVVASAFATGAYAQRDAASKIRGDYSFSGPSRSRPSYSMRSSDTTARRSFSYDSAAPRASQGTRSYSYQPQGNCSCR